MTIDRELIAAKIESIRKCLVRVQKKCPNSPAALGTDVDAQDIVVLNLERAVQLAVDIATHILSDAEISPPGSMVESMGALATLGILSPELATRMKKAIGFRNLAVHEYDQINWTIVHAIATTHLKDFKDFVEAVNKHLDKK